MDTPDLIHRQALMTLIKENRYLFWSVSSANLDQISLDSIIETFLNFSDVKEIKRLIEIVGIRTVAEIFYKQTGRKRHNYHNRTINFFNLYFGVCVGSYCIL